MSCFCCTACADVDLMERKLFCAPTKIFNYSHMAIHVAFVLPCHRTDRTRVLLRLYQAWGSKEDKVVWALTTKDLVLIKVTNILSVLLGVSFLREGLSQCSAAWEKWLEHSARPWLREKLPQMWAGIHRKNFPGNIVSCEMYPLYFLELWTRASWSDLETVTETCCDFCCPSRWCPWATQPSPGPAVGPAAWAEQRRPWARAREGPVPRGTGLEWWQGQQGHARQTGTAPRFPRWLRSAGRLPGWFPPRQEIWPSTAGVRGERRPTIARWEMETRWTWASLSSWSQGIWRRWFQPGASWCLGRTETFRWQIPTGSRGRAFPRKARREVRINLFLLLGLKGKWRELFYSWFPFH